jgi:hypothetical protein
MKNQWTQTSATPSQIPAKDSPSCGWATTGSRLTSLTHGPASPAGVKYCFEKTANCSTEHSTATLTANGVSSIRDRSPSNRHSGITRRTRTTSCAKQPKTPLPTCSFRRCSCRRSRACVRMSPERHESRLTPRNKHAIATPKRADDVHRVVRCGQYLFACAG